MKLETLSYSRTMDTQLSRFHDKAIPFGWLLSTLFYCTISILSYPVNAAELLPDLVVTSSSLEDNDMVQNIMPGRLHLRLSTGVANIGAGPLFLRADGNLAVDSIQPVFQRIYDDGNGFTEQEAGYFIYHQLHGHIHFANWTQFRLRTILPGDGVGPIVASGSKVTFCIVDEDVFNPSLPRFDPDGRFFECGSTGSTNVVQGISVGWVDTYDKSLPDQNIDITDVTPGEYWLEAEADPLNLIAESDETNNLARIKYAFIQESWDSHEPNDFASALPSKPLGVSNSSNLGPCGPERVISDLSLHDGADRDHFRFYMNSTGGSADFIQIEFPGQPGNLGLQLLDSTYTILRGSISGPSRIVSLSGYPKGWYYARVYSLNGQGNGRYTLTVNPPSNQPPTLTLLKPGQGAWVHDGDLFNTTWQISDPDNTESWVTIYVNSQPVIDGNEIELPQSRLTPGSLGFHAINTAHLTAGTYYIFARVTDGGEISGSWADSPLRVLNPECCESRGDLQPLPDGSVDLLDLTVFVDHFFIDFQPLRCPNEANLDGLPGLTIDDILVMIDNLFISFSPLLPCPN